MGVMRAEDDVLICLARKIGQHIVDGGAGSFDLNGKRCLKMIGEGNRKRFATGVDLLLNVLQRRAHSLEPILSNTVFDLREEDADILGPAQAAKMCEQVFFTIPQLSVD